jgi:hypothetical protein
MLIALTAALGTMGAIVYTRMSMELDKQRLSALSVARDHMERVHSHHNVSSTQVDLVDFNTPVNTPNLKANVIVDYFPITNDGDVNFAIPLELPTNDRPYYCRVTVSWFPSGRWQNLRGNGKPQTVTISSAIRKSF